MDLGRVSGLLTDSYHFAMVQSYLDCGMMEPAVFEFFVRKMPRNRNFLIAAGLEQVLEFVETLHFSKDEIGWLQSTGHYKENFLTYLKSFRFSGDIYALPEGTLFFQNEPILRVRASLPEAQLLETRIINLLHYQTLVASKAARSVLAAKGKTLVDFGLRRAHGAEAGLLAARASYLAGFNATSTVLAGKLFGIPLSGTMAHSFIQAYQSETDAFERFARSNPDNIIVLLDTYDSILAAKKVAQIAPSLRQQGFNIRGVRLDSGNLAEQAIQVREILNDALLPEIMIFASGGIDEVKIKDLLDKHVPIDGFGVGTHLATSEDAAYLDCAYKLVEFAGRPTRKLSFGKATLPGSKQVFRFQLSSGQYNHDVVGLEKEDLGGLALLKPFLKNGRRMIHSVPLFELRKQCMANLADIPKELTTITEQLSYDVCISQRLEDLTNSLNQ